MLRYSWAILSIVALLIAIGANGASIHLSKSDEDNVSNVETTDDVELLNSQRIKRSGRGYGRGQTQSQYLNFGQHEQEGKAEAEANESGSRSIVSGSHGMGQAQSQFSLGDCSECVATPIYEYPAGSPDPLTLVSGGGRPGSGGTTQTQPGIYGPGIAAGGRPNAIINLPGHGDGGQTGAGHPTGGGQLRPGGGITGIPSGGGYIPSAPGVSGGAGQQPTGQSPGAIYDPSAPRQPTSVYPPGTGSPIGGPVTGQPSHVQQPNISGGTAGQQGGTYGPGNAGQPNIFYRPPSGGQPNTINGPSITYPPGTQPGHTDVTYLPGPGGQPLGTVGQTGGRPGSGTPPSGGVQQPGTIYPPVGGSQPQGPVAGGHVWSPAYEPGQPTVPVGSGQPPIGGPIYGTGVSGQPGQSIIPGHPSLVPAGTYRPGTIGQQVQQRPAVVGQPTVVYMPPGSAPPNQITSGQPGGSGVYGPTAPVSQVPSGQPGGSGVYGPTAPVSQVPSGQPDFTYRPATPVSQVPGNQVPGGLPGVSFQPGTNGYQIPGQPNLSFGPGSGTSPGAGGQPGVILRPGTGGPQISDGQGVGISQLPGRLPGNIGGTGTVQISNGQPGQAFIPSPGGQPVGTYRPGTVGQIQGGQPGATFVPQVPNGQPNILQPPGSGVQPGFQYIPGTGVSQTPSGQPGLSYQPNTIIPQYPSEQPSISHTPGTGAPGQYGVGGGAPQPNTLIPQYPQYPQYPSGQPSISNIPGTGVSGQYGVGGGASQVVGGGASQVVSGQPTGSHIPGVQGTGVSQLPGGGSYGPGTGMPQIQGGQPGAGVSNIPSLSYIPGIGGQQGGGALGTGGQTNGVQSQIPGAGAGTGVYPTPGAVGYPGGFVIGGEGQGSLGGPSNLVTTSGVSGGVDDAFSQAETSITDGQAAASAQGKKNGGTAKTQVSGTYSSSGTFSANAMTSDSDRSANAQVSGSVEGAMSQSQGQGGAAQSQSQVQVNAKTGGTKASSQSGGITHQSQSEVQANDKGGLADAQSSGPGQTSSQAQIGFRPGQNNEVVSSAGGGQASAQSGSYSGQSQSQIQGTSKYGVSYHGAAQSASGTKEQVATYREQNRQLFHTISQFGANDAVTDRVDTIYSGPALTSESETIPDLQLKASKSSKEAASNNNNNNDKINGDDKRLSDEDDEEDPYDEYDDEEEYYNENPIKLDESGNPEDTKKDELYNTYTQKSPTQTQQVAVSNPNDKYTVVQNQNGRVQRYPIRTTTEIVPNGFRGTVNVEKKFHTKALEVHNTDKVNVSSEHTGDTVGHTKLRTPDSYVTVTKSVTGSMDNTKNPPQENKNFQSTYYTKSSTCGYFTFSCNIVYGANGRSKICRPKAPTNGKC